MMSGEDMCPNKDKNRVTSKGSRVFVCQVVPQAQLKEFDCSQAGNNFCLALIEGVHFDRVISLIPCQVKPDIRRECRGEPYEAIQCRWLKQNAFFRPFNMLIENLQCILKCRKATAIWFYNVTPHNLLAVMILRYLMQRRVYVLFADLSEQWAMFRECAWMVRHSSGVLSLSSRVNFEHTNLLAVPGIVKPTKSRPKPPSAGSRIFMFSGSFNGYTGLKMALEVFAELPEVTLLVSGNGDSASVEDYAARYPNIRYLGYLPFDEYLKVLDEVAVGVSFRDPGYEENCNNFPSKILDYLNRRKAVISTLHYPELDGIKYFESAYDKEAIKDMVRQIIAMPDPEFRIYCSQDEAVQKRFGYVQWNNAVGAVEGNAGHVR